MSEQPDKGDRTEAPTEKRLEDARKEGQVPASRDVTSLLILSTGLLLVSPLMGSVFQGLIPPLASLLEQPHLISVDQGELGRLSLGLARAVIAVLLLPLLALAAAAVISNLAQHGVVFSLKPVMPALNKVSPIAGVKRLFSPKAFAEFLKNLAKIGLVGLAAWWALAPMGADVVALVDVPPVRALDVLQSWAMRGLGAALIVVAIVAIADYALQRHSHWENLKMTRQQVRDEHKQSDGDPQVKAKIRQLRTQRSRQRMMQAVPEATVVITNPTHYAVALRYEPGQKAAPEVTAKGADALAFRIRALAREHHVPVIENRPLARALYADVEVGRSVPPKHFEAVAEVIGFVLRQRDLRRS